MDRLTSMQIFLRVAETESFSRASSDLKMTQPTVTKHIAALEKKLGVHLLYRNTRGVSLTECGQQYYQRVKRICADIQEAESQVSQLQQQLSGRIRISASQAFGRWVATPLLVRFMSQQPEIHIELQIEDRYVDLVESGVDLALRLGNLPASSLGARRIGRNPWVLVAAPSYLKRHEPIETPEALAQHECLVYSTVPNADNWHFSRGGQTASVAVQGRLRCNSLSTVLSACSAGLGVAQLPWYVAREALLNGQVIALLEHYTLAEQDIHAVVPAPRNATAKVQHLIQYLQHHLSDGWWMGQR